MEQANDRSALAARVRIHRAQKAWKFIRDVNNTSLCDLNRVALEDGAHSYTYGLMFREWERYASVFSALGMTGEAHSRVGLLGSTCVETIFALYGLNMVGADVSIVPTYSALMPKRIIQTIRDERLTDFIVTDDFAQANLINELFLRQKELGLEHIILLHVPVNGVTVHPMLTAAQEAKYHQIKGFYKPICMDELLAAHGNHPVRYAPEDSGDTINNYTLKFHKALKKNGRPCKLVYFGDEELQHVFPIMDPEHPKSLEATDKMLEWFEHWAEVRRESRKGSAELEQRQQALQARIKDGSLARQKVWSSLKERVLVNESNLNRTAIIDCTRNYTYAEMFAEWERYARVFSGLGICAENQSRAALCGVITAEPLFALYALNMTGAEVSLFSYPDFLPGGMWRTMLEKEHITDLIISDIMVTPEVWKEICEARESLGLRHVILMHSLMGGAAVGPAELVYNEFNYHSLKRRSDTVFMEDLLKRYRNTPIRYDESNGERTAFITHTSGTSGTKKLLPFTDMVFNKALEMLPKGMHTFLQGPDNGKPLRCVQVFDISSIMALSGQVHTVFAQADTLVVTFFGFIHPKFVRALDFYNIEIMSITGFMVDNWLKRTDLDELDLCALKVVGMSGGYIPPEKMERYRAFFRAHGCTCDISAGYGMSEAGSKLMFAPHGNKRDILGFAKDRDSFRIKDEQDGQFYRPEDGPRTGLLYICSDVGSGNELDGKVIFEYTQIDGRQYVCTNDLVQVNEDGSLSYAGRTDQFFVNNKGRKFDSGIVNRCLSAHSAVENCAVVPVMEKRINDTVPVLFVVPSEKGPGAAESIRKALVDVYVKEKQIGADNLPTQFMLVNEIPLNANGKLDIFRITRQRMTGDAYDLVPIMENEALTDIRTKHVEQANGFTAETLPEGMENHSAYNFFDFFQAAGTGEQKSAGGWNPPHPIWPFIGAGKQKKQKMPEELWKAVLKYVNRLVGLSTGRKSYDFDFED